MKLHAYDNNLIFGQNNSEKNLLKKLKEHVINLIRPKRFLGFNFYCSVYLIIKTPAIADVIE